MNPDWIYIVRTGSVRVEVDVKTSDSNIWPIDYKLWETFRVVKHSNYTAIVINEK